MADKGQVAAQTGEPLPFTLQDGENIISEVIPDRRGFILSRSFSGVIPAIVIALIGIASSINAGTLVLVLVPTITFVIVELIAVVVALIAYNKFKYWLTNHRVIGRRGIIGYSINSIPLENVTDVVINRGVIDRILTLSSITIVPIGGMQFVPRGKYGSGNVNYFPALKPQHAVELQALIFKLRDERKKETGRVF
jgi:uncharacterized membrane protein YdbT with pleckstrin-like domain